MSPYLKSKVPLGSLGIDVTRTPEISAAEQQDVTAVSRGWKMESFQSAADKLLRSAERLEETVAAETQYWSEVLAVKDKGWKVCRLPRERQTLGVQFGFMEATATFRDRGLAALRRGDGGRVVLDRGVGATAPKGVRVRVRLGDKTVGMSMPEQIKKEDTTSVEADIRQARDSLFEEELFYELYREARSMMKHGVDVKRDLILFPAGDEKKIVIDLVDLDETEQNSAEEDLLAESIAQSLRLLLTHAHRKNLLRRSRIPPPLTVKPRPTPEYALLKPTVAYLDHKSHFQWLSRFLSTLSNTLSSAGLTCNPQSFPLTSRHTLNSCTPDTLLDALLTPLESYLTIPLVTPTHGIRIRIATNTHITGHGTDFSILTNLPALSHAMTKPRVLGLRSEVSDLITHIFTLDLVSYISTLSSKVYIPPPPPESPFKGPPMFPSYKPQKPKQTSGWDVDSSSDSDSEPESDTEQSPLAVKPYNPYYKFSAKKHPRFKNTYLAPWTPSFSAGGELAAYSPKLDRVRRMVVRVEEEEFRVGVEWMGKGTRGLVYDEGDKEERSVWKGKGRRWVWRAGEEKREETLEGIVRRLGVEEEDGDVDAGVDEGAEGAEKREE